MRDLELRGAGNILGAEQSGHINGIGFDLYSQLLKESVNRIKNNDGSSDIFCDIKLSFVIFAELNNGNKNTNTHAYAIINKSYIKKSNLRIYYNRILSLAKNASDLGKIKEEIQNKYGKFTNEMSNLYLFHKIRLISQKKGFSLVKNNENKLLCEYSNKCNKYYKIGSRFPRLTKSNPKLRLIEVFNLINNIKN